MGAVWKQHTFIWSLLAEHCCQGLHRCHVGLPWQAGTGREPMLSHPLLTWLLHAELTHSTHTATEAEVTPTGGAHCPNIRTCFCLFSVEKRKVAVVVARFRQLSAAACVSWPFLATAAPLYASDQASCFSTGVFSIKCSVCVANSQAEYRTVRVTVPVMPQGNTVCINQSGHSLT